jgi:transcriptional regulator with XRE-family HTH domain
MRGSTVRPGCEHTFVAPRTYPPYIRDKARAMRTERNLSIDEIAERLALPRTTVFYWLRDLPIDRSARPRTLAQLNGSIAMQAKYRRLREAAYAEGRESLDEPALDPSFRDVLCLYLAEGYKRNRNCLAVGNSDPAIVRVCDQWLRRLSTAKRDYAVQYHADQDLDELRVFWGATLGIEPHAVRMQRKSNSSQLARRTWRSVHGVLTVRVNDTLLRARLDGWMDRLRESWL